MLRNLTISPELDKEDWDPDVITRMIIIAPGAHVSESEIVNELHMLDLPLTIKNTCYGSMVSGKTKDVFEAIREIRKLDSNHIFTKERGFAPGDPRRCRGHRFGPREGFHQMENEYRLLGDVADALENPRDVKVAVEKPIDVDEFKKIMNECLENNNDKCKNMVKVAIYPPNSLILADLIERKGHTPLVLQKQIRQKIKDPEIDSPPMNITEEDPIKGLKYAAIEVPSGVRGRMSIIGPLIDEAEAAILVDGAPFGFGCVGCARTNELSIFLLRQRDIPILEVTYPKNRDGTFLMVNQINEFLDSLKGE